MSGAGGSDDDMVVGRVNWSDGGTALWAKVPPGEANFDGAAILTVEVAKDYSPDDGPDDYDDGATFVPSNLFHGIMAAGFSGSVPFGGTPGAVGVIGRGGRNQGTGVRGLGGGSPEPGNGGAGGIGVHGLGGPQAAFFADPTTPPGAGVIGQGGRQDDKSNTLRLPHAAGVVAIGGGTGPTMDALPAHTLMETGGIGVYGQGAELTITMVPPSDGTGTIPGPDVPSGPSAPGAGVLGRGGVPMPAGGMVAAGVIGLAGATPIPPFVQSSDNGVFGAGPVGIRGEGSTGPGLIAASSSGPAAILRSQKRAQAWLVPLEIPDPTSLPSSESGELLVTIAKESAAADARNVASLWFCKFGTVKGVAGGEVWVKIA